MDGRYNEQRTLGGAEILKIPGSRCIEHLIEPAVKVTKTTKQIQWFKTGKYVYLYV